MGPVTGICEHCNEQLVSYRTWILLTVDIFFVKKCFAMCKLYVRFNYLLVPLHRLLDCHNSVSCMPLYNTGNWN